MLPIFVLLSAFSALASAGTVKVIQVSTNDPQYRTNSPVARYLSNIGDSGHVSPNLLNVVVTLRELSTRGGNQALVNGQLLAYLGETSVGRPGDSCAAANYINAYTRYVASGNPAGVREALGNYVQSVASGVDNIVRRASSSDSVKLSRGQRGRCANEGKSYDLDSAWDIILGSVPANQQELIAEQSSVAKRLYCSYRAISNNVGATITASALPPTVQVYELASRALLDFFERLGNNADLGQSAANLKSALVSSVAKACL